MSILAMTKVTSRTVHVWQRNGNVLMALWKTELLPPFLEPIMNILALGIGLGRFVQDVQGVPYIQFIAPGFICSSVMFSSSFECMFGSFVRMTYQRTYDAILATPLNIEDVIMGEMLWGATRGLVSGVVVLIVITAFGLTQSPWALLVLPMSLYAGLTFAAGAMFATSVIQSIDQFNYYFALGITPMFLISGIFFPLEGLPQAVQIAAWFSPLTHLVRVVRAVVLGAPEWGHLLDVAWLGVASFVLVNVALWLMRRRLIV
jgi:lipooligosaccharide transport system permease protein